MILFFYFRLLDTTPTILSLFSFVAQDFCAKFFAGATCCTHSCSGDDLSQTFNIFSCAAVWNDQNGAYQTHFIWFDIVYCSYGLNYS